LNGIGSNGSSTLIPIDQPDALAVIDEVARQKIVVAEDEIDGADCKLELCYFVEKLRQARGIAAAALGKGMRVVTDDVEDPEGQRRTAEVLRQLAMDSLQEWHDRGKACRVADILRGAGTPLDEAHDEDARLRMDDFGRDPGTMGGLTRRPLVEAHHMVDRDIVADTDDEALAGVLDQEIDIGDPAGEPHRLDRALPDGQFLDTFAGDALRIRGGHRIPRAPWRRIPDDTAEAGKLVNLRNPGPGRLLRKEAMGYHSRA
jgi:hypothetical protein